MWLRKRLSMYRGWRKQMLQHKGYKYRIYPSAEQQRQLASLFGCRRFVYSYFLELRQKTYKEQKRNVSKNECMRLLTQLKKGKEYAWLNGVDSMALQEAVKDLDRAYQRRNASPFREISSRSVRNILASPDDDMSRRTALGTRQTASV